MSWYYKRNQKNVPRGQVRVVFDVSILGKRYPPKQLTCFKSQVEDLYRKWYLSLTDGKQQQYKLLALFENYHKYISDYQKSESIRVSRDTGKLCHHLYKGKVLSEFNRNDVDRFISNLQHKGFKPSTINRYIACMSHFFSWCIQRQYYEKVNPFFKSKLPVSNKRHVRVFQAELVELLEKAGSYGEDFQLFITMLIFTGMRRNELFNVKWSDVDFTRRLIFIPAWRSKHGEMMSKYLTPDLSIRLLAWKNSHHGSENIFSTFSSDAVVEHRWKQLRKTLSFNKISDGTLLRLHDLRHIFAQLCLDSGISLDDVKDLLGHKDIRTTQERYIHYARPDLGEKVVFLDNVIPQKRKSS